MSGLGDYSKQFPSKKSMGLVMIVMLIGFIALFGALLGIALLLVQPYV